MTTPMRAGKTPTYPPPTPKTKKGRSRKKGC